MYKVIMVPTDGSGFDREAIRVALRTAERCNAKVRLVRVLGTSSFFSLAAPTEEIPAAAVDLSERDQAWSELYALAAECRSESKADITADLHGGPVGDVLEGYARRHHVDLIVISTHGRSGLARLSFGSVTDSLIRHTTIPVLVVKPPTSYLNPRPSEAFRHVVVPLDGSRLAEQILPGIVALARVEDAEITLLSVLTPGSNSHQDVVDPTLPWWEKDISVARSYLFQVAGTLRRSGTPVRTDIVIGDNVAGAIGDYAGRERADLIAIATHGRGGLARMLHGSVATAVMQSAKVSMLVLKPDTTAELEAAPSEISVTDEAMCLR
jgi:nucleotide-binding universal stress UspA family protein